VAHLASRLQKRLDIACEIDGLRRCRRKPGRFRGERPHRRVFKSGKQQESEYSPKGTAAGESTADCMIWKSFDCRHFLRPRWIHQREAIEFIITLDRRKRRPAGDRRR